MSLPKQVQQQIEAANRIRESLDAGKKPDTSAPEAPVEPVKASEPTPAPAPAPAPQPAPAASPEFIRLQQQYSTLQGIHRTLVHKNGELQSQAKSLQAQVDALKADNETLRTKLAEKPAAPAPSPITEEEVKEFGPDLISVIERKAREVAAPIAAELANSKAEVERLNKRNAELEQSVTGISASHAEDARARFSADLMRLVPDFDTLNYDNNFLSWLSQVDPLDARRRTLQDRLNEAVEIGDAQAVAGFFHTFKSLLPPPEPPQKPDLSAQAQPAPRPTPDVSVQAPGVVWTGEKINQFYADVSKGRYSQQDKLRIEREIFLAQKENRIAA